MGKLSRLQFKKQEEKEREETLQKLLKESKKLHKNPLKILKNLDNEAIKYYHFHYENGYWQLGYLLQYTWKKDDKTREIKDIRKAFYESVAFLLKIGAGRMLENKDVVLALKTVLEHKNQWLRDLKAWKPSGKKRKALFSSLLRHLFCNYYVPEFMDQAWYDDDKTQIIWFIHIGSGNNIRTANFLPLELTKKMAHHFIQAPRHFTISEALRYGQVMGLGGDKKKASQIVATKLGDSFEEDAFWKTVLHFFINQSNISQKEMKCLIAYVEIQKYGVREDYNDEVLVAPENPGFSMKGRTLQSLLPVAKTRMDRAGKVLMEWEGYPAEDFKWQTTRDNKEITYEVIQIKNSFELEVEGDAMKHCVGGYMSDCLKKTSFIWAMRMIDEQGKMKRLLTIETNKEGQLVQARAKCNARPGGIETAILKKWMQANNFEYAPSFND